jgi:hypothetical protein
LCLGVVVVGVLLVVGVVLVVDEEELLLPHPATATVLARMAAVVSMAVSGVLLMGRAPVVVERGFGRSPYQAFAGPIAVADLHDPSTPAPPTISQLRNLG